MSIAIMQEVWSRAPVDQGTLLVLLALADSADEGTRTCYPGIDSTLAPKTRLSARQVKRCLADLQEAGIIEVKRNASPVRTNLYRIEPAEAWRSDILSPTETSAEVTFATPRSDAHVTSEVTPMSPEPSVTSDEPSDHRGDGLFSADGETVEQADPFEQWWQAYPETVRGRKAEKKKTREKFWKIVHAGECPADELIAAVKRHAASNPDPQFVPAPLVWLNKERWLAWPEVRRRRYETQGWEGMQVFT